MQKNNWLILFIFLLSFSFAWAPIPLYSQDSLLIEDGEKLLAEINKNFDSNALDSVFIKANKLMQYSTEHKIEYLECKSYEALGDYYRYSGSPDSSNIYYYKAFELYDLTSVDFSPGKINTKIALNLRSLNLIDSAIYHYLQAYDYLKAANDTMWAGVVSNHLGFVYFMQGNYFLALKYMQLAIEEFQKLNHRENIGSIYNTMGLIYRNTNDKQKEENSYLKAIENLEAIDETATLAMAYNNLSEVYFDKGETERAFASLEKAKIIYQNVDFPLGLCSYYSVLSYYYSTKDPPDNQKVIEYCLKSLSIAEEYEDFRQYSDITSYLGIAYLNTGQATKAKNILEKGLVYAESYEFTAEYVKITEALSAVYKALNQPEKALFYIEKHMFYSDSLSSEEKIKEFTSLDLEFEFRQQQIRDSIAQMQKDQEVSFLHHKEIQRQKFTKLVFVFISILVILIAIFMFLNARKNKKQAALLNEKNKLINQSLKEKDLLFREVHHRVKNNFQLVSSLLELQSREIEDSAALKTISEGQHRVRSMALIHQRLYQNERISTINFKEYCEQLVHEIQAMYDDGNKVETRIKVDDVYYDIDTAIPLGLILNELITNSFKYAFAKIENPTLRVSITSEKSNHYLLTVRDNGGGLPADLDIAKTKSLGLRLVKRLSKQLQGNFNYSYDNGCLFKISFKDSRQRKASE